MAFREPDLGVIVLRRRLRVRGGLAATTFTTPLLQTWGLDPADLLMVGDSFEDVECGNASGTATCLVAGRSCTCLRTDSLSGACAASIACLGFRLLVHCTFTACSTRRGASEPAAGGGNEKPGTVVLPPPGAVATFTVSGLSELAERLATAGEKGPQAAGVALGWPVRLAAGEAIGAEGERTDRSF